MLHGAPVTAMAIIIVLACLAAGGILLYRRARRVKARLPSRSRYFSVDLARPEAAEAPAEPIR